MTAVGRQLSGPSREQLMAVYNVKYFRFGEQGWGPRQRLSFGHFSPDDYYEALVASLVTPGCSWADVGCGRDIFPSHPDLSRELCTRAQFVLGIDPDDNIKDNPFISEGFQGMIEDCTTAQRFDVISMRMVAEHIVDPDRVMRKLAELLKPGGRLVIYTPYKWAPMSIVATIVPFRFHNPLKRIIWRSEARDTFPTAYKLNTRRDLRAHTSRHGLDEVYFRFLDDCRVTNNYRALNWIELQTCSLLNKVGLNYPEKCVLAVYEKSARG
jgi:SAM-dependent methyltransferase